MKRRRPDFAPEEPATTGSRPASTHMEAGAGQLGVAGLADDWKAQMETALAFAHDPGTFACSAVVPAARIPQGVPEVQVEGVGRLTFPLSSEQATAISLEGRPAPYGQGRNTVLDPAVRHAIQIDAPGVHIAPSWEPILQRIKNEALAKLGLEKAVANDCEARLYKLLLYPPGGHFMPHRDTEKEPGMFATLIVQLPAGHEGGALKVKHAGKKFVWDSAAGSERDVQYAAFYADCEHQLKPVTKGWRIVLAYNLVQTSAGPLPSAPCDGLALQALQDAVRAWEACPGAQDRVAMRLKHYYTKANLSFRKLKGRDGAVVGLLRACNLLDVHLVLMIDYRMDTFDPDREPYGAGWDDYGDYEGNRSDDGPYDPDEGNLYEPKDVNYWVSPAGPVSTPGQRVKQEEMLGNDKLFNSRPDDEVRGYTGNEGPGVLYTYHTTLVVVWPRSRRLEIARKGGLYKLRDALAQWLQTPWEEAGDERAQQQALVLSGLEDWATMAEEQTGQTQAFPGSSLCAFELLNRAAQSVAGDAEAKQWVAAVTVRMVKLLMSPKGAGSHRSHSPKLSHELASLAVKLDCKDLDSMLVDLVGHWASTQATLCTELVALPFMPNHMSTTVLVAFLEQLSVDNVRDVARMVWRDGAAGADPEIVTRFCAAVSQHGQMPELLSVLADEPVVCEALARERDAGAGGPLTGLVIERMRALESSVACSPPVFSWVMPGAKLPKYPQVQAFLRGPEQQQVFRVFHDLRHARNWANKYFGGRAGTHRTDGYSAKAEEGVDGQGPFCTVTKTRDLYNKKADQFNQELTKAKTELAQLQAMLGMEPSTGADPAPSPGPASALSLSAAPAPAYTVVPGPSLFPGLDLSPASAPDHGSGSVQASVPAPISAAASAQPPGQVPPAGLLQAQPHPCTVVVIDDEPQIGAPEEVIDLTSED